MVNYSPLELTRRRCLRACVHTLAIAILSAPGNSLGDPGNDVAPNPSNQSTQLPSESMDHFAYRPGEQVPCQLKLEAGSEPVHFLLYTPEDYQQTGDGCPLMLFLHGLGESGVDQLERVKIHGPPKLVSQGADLPFAIVAPQCPPPSINEVYKAWRPELLVELVDSVCAQLNVDRQRLYVTGLSMGGFGTWRLVAHAPQKFAAAIPICGGGDPDWAKDLAAMPIWCFHGAKDEIVELSHSQRLIDAIEQAGGKPRFTIYPDAGHDSWSETYANDAVYEWLLSHQLSETKE